MIDRALAKVWQPAPANVKNVVVIMAGQSECDGVHNGMTGQPGHYKWDSLGMTNTRQIASNGVAMLAMQRFDPSDTALYLVCDSGYRFELSYAQRVQIQKAYRNWIYSLAADPDIVYLAGSSRGGCLSYILTSQLTDAGAYPNFNDTNFIVQGGLLNNPVTEPISNVTRIDG